MSYERCEECGVSAPVGFLNKYDGQRLCEDCIEEMKDDEEGDEEFANAFILDHPEVFDSGRCGCEDYPCCGH